MSFKHQKGKFKKGKKNKNNGGGSNIGHGNFDDLMKGFVIMTDRDREKNAVSDANNFLIPVRQLQFLKIFIIEEMYPSVYDITGTNTLNESGPTKKLKVENQTDEINKQKNENEKINDKGEDLENSKNEEQENKIELEQENIEDNEEENEGDEQQQQNDQESDQEQDEENEGKCNQNEVENNEQTGDVQKDDKQQSSQSKTTNDKLEQELSQLKQQKDKLLYNVKTDVKCTVFLKVNSKLMNSINVTEVVEHVMNKVHVEKTSLTRFCHRMYPAEYAFRADEASLKKNMELLIKDKICTDAPSSVKLNQSKINYIEVFNNIQWMLECKSRNNSKFNRKVVLDIVNSLMPNIHFVDYKNPFYTVVVDICHNLMCICILKNYNDFKKYSVKVNPQLNNVKDYSFLNQNKPTPKVIVPVTEEQQREMEQKQEEQRAQLRSEQIVKQDEEEDDVDLI